MDDITPTAPSVQSPFFGLDRNAPARRFLERPWSLPWWRRVCIRIGFWFLARGGV